MTQEETEYIENHISVKKSKLQLKTSPQRENGTLLHSWWECKLVQPLCYDVTTKNMMVPQKTKNRVAIPSSNPTPGHILKV